MEERRASRKITTSLDQELLNHVRASFDEHYGAIPSCPDNKWARFFESKTERFRKGYSSSSGERPEPRGIDQASFQAAVISLVLGDDQAKLKFVFDLHDQDGTRP